MHSGSAPMMAPRCSKLSAGPTRIWSVLQPLCTKAVGKTEIADLLGAQTCLNLIQNQSAREDPEAYLEDGAHERRAALPGGSGRKFRTGRGKANCALDALHSHPKVTSAEPDPGERVVQACRAAVARALRCCARTAAVARGSSRRGIQHRC